MQIFERIRKRREAHRDAQEKLQHVESLTRELEKRVRRLEAESAVFRRTARSYIRGVN